MSNEVLSTSFFIAVDGTELDPNIKADVLEVVVDQHVHLPDMFTIRLTDEGLELLNDGGLDLTKTVKISADNEGGDQATLIEGEITALEPNFNLGMNAELVVRGYDKSHRLFREVKSQAHLNKKDSDLANEIAQGVGLQADVETTSTVYDHIYQHNQSDLAFLMHRAWRIGYECFVSDGKLHFRKPPSGGDAVTLTWGNELLSFYPRMTLAEQVDEVIVRGWDVEKIQPIVGKAKASDSTLFPNIEESKDGAQWAGSFGNGKLVIVDQPVVSQAEADALAKARYNEVSGAFVEAEGTAYRMPQIKAGKMVKLEGIGRFSGQYLVTSATHTYAPDGLSTNFTVRGARTGTLAEQITPQHELNQWPGGVTAIVTNSDDPQAWGRVKVKFPWMTDDAESDWARVVALGAGASNAGLYMIPDVGDEVFVVFEHGDFGRPYVLGGLWNGKHAPPTDAGSGGEQTKTRIWQSKNGHTIATYDTSDDKIALQTVGGMQIFLDDANKKIEIISSGGNSIVIDDNSRKITVDSVGDIELNASMNMKLQAGANLDMEASGQLKIKGATIDIQASGPTTVKGAIVNLN